MFISLINPQMVSNICYRTLLLFDSTRVKSYWPLTDSEHKALTHSYGTKQKTEDRV